MKQPMWRRADERFFWNRYLMERMIDLTETGGVDVRRRLPCSAWRAYADSAFVYIAEPLHTPGRLRMCAAPCRL